MPVKNFDKYVKMVRSQSGKFSVANGGSGTAQDLGAAYLDLQANMKSLHVPYKGSAPATNDLLGGQVQAMLDNMVTQIPHIKSRRLRAIAITAPSRMAILPDVPTVAEAGVPGFKTSTWYGIIAPAQTPGEVVNRRFGMEPTTEWYSRQRRSLLGAAAGAIGLASTKLLQASTGFA